MYYREGLRTGKVPYEFTTELYYGYADAASYHHQYIAGISHEYTDILSSIFSIWQCNSYGNVDVHG
jgi:23S rRNA maturation-related 3'-5' exoribonuclease YhaM